MKIGSETIVSLVATAFILTSSITASTAFAMERFVNGYVTHVRDGDTIEVAGVPIRFDGVAAPELSEPYGEQAKLAMRGLVAGNQVRCELTGDKTYDGIVRLIRLEAIPVPAVASGDAKFLPLFQ